MAKGLITVPVFLVFLILFGLSEIVNTTTKDGFNIYKDLLRGKGDDEGDVAELIDDGRGSKVSYFYRTPALGINLRSGQIPADSGKRTINRFKNYMLGKDNQGEEEMQKRGSFLGWTLSNRQNFDHEGRSFAGINRPATFAD